MVTTAEQLGADHSWTPVDIASVLSVDFHPPKPTVGSRNDGAGVLYPGKTHIIASEPEAGKTWLALHLCQLEMAQGHKVVYIDFEDDAVTILSRLRAMGVTDESLLNLFTYIAPQSPLTDPDRLIDLVRDLDPTLVVVDGVTEAMTTQGLALVDNQAVAEFFRLFPVPISHLGPAVLLLDHEVKRSQDRGSYPIGAQHKLAGVTGAAFKLKKKQEFAIGRPGSSQLHVAKDRPGEVRRRVLDREDDLFGELVVSSSGPDFVEVQLAANIGEVRMSSRADSMRSRILEQMGDQAFSTKSEITSKVTGNSLSKSQALNRLIADGVVSDTKPYRVLASTD